MLPTLLSSNLCSIQGGQERFALSCIFEMRPDDASVVKSEFCKSVIRSRVRKVKCGPPYQIIAAHRLGLGLVAKLTGSHDVFRGATGD